MKVCRAWGALNLLIVFRVSTHYLVSIKLVN